MKHLYVLLGVLMAVWIAFRVYVINSEIHRVVFNPMRNDTEQGLAVEKIVLNQQTGTLKEPLVVKNNHSFVSCTRIDKFKVGQVVGSGRIISVNDNIDLDSGMCIVKTSGVDDGANFAETKRTGFFIPIYAVHDGSIMIDENGVAVKRSISMVGQDSENVYVTAGLQNGDTVILSDVAEGAKIR